MWQKSCNMCDCDGTVQRGRGTTQRLNMLGAAVSATAAGLHCSLMMQVSGLELHPSKDTAHVGSELHPSKDNTCLRVGAAHVSSHSMLTQTGLWNLWSRNTWVATTLLLLGDA